MSSNDNLIFEESNSAKDIQFISQKIEEYEIEQGFSNQTENCFLIKNSDNEIIAGASVSLFHKILYIENIWVHNDYRKRKLGSELMERIENFAKKNNFNCIMLDTMSFFAPDFYLKLGYKIEFRKDNCEKNSSFFYFAKSLDY